MDDRQLLAQYVSDRSPEAFAELVRRYANLVYSSARRQLGKSDLAEDVSQAVFILLLRRAGTVQGPLGGWLIRTTYFACRDARKMEARRCAREGRAAEMKMQELRESASCHWDDYSSLLDGALAQLSRVDRDAVVLRFMQGMTLKETGDAMGISEATAQKRAERGLERLRNTLKAKTQVPAAAIMASHLGARAVEAAPAGLATKIAASAATAHNTVAASIALKTGCGMLISKMKVAAIVLLVLGMAAAAGSSVVKLLEQNSEAALPAPSAARGPATLAQTGAGEVVQILRYDVLLSDGAYPSVTQLKSQKVDTGASALPAAVYDTGDLHRVILDAINMHGAESFSMIHAYSADTWSAAHKSVVLLLNKQGTSGRAWVNGRGEGTMSSTIVDPDHRTLNLNFPAIKLQLMEGPQRETDAQASISYDGMLGVGSSLVFEDNVTGAGAAVYHLLIVYETVKAPDWEFAFFDLTPDLKWYMRSGPEGVSKLAARAVVWAARAAHPANVVPAEYEQALPDGTMARALAITRVDTYPLCWWDPQGQPVVVPQYVPLLSQYLSHPTFIQVEVTGPPEAYSNASPLAPSSATTRPEEYRLMRVLSTGHTAHAAFWAPYGPWKQVGTIQPGQSVNINGARYVLRGVTAVGAGEVETDLHTDQAGGDAITLTAVLNDGREISAANSDGILGKTNPNPSPVFLADFKPGDVQVFHVWQRKRKLVSFPDFPQRPTEVPETDVTPEQVNGAVSKLQQSGDSQ
jgi:RNA polymerase sigma factor (sigma-70 family)